MSTLADMILAYAVVTIAGLYLARGWIKRLIFRIDVPTDEGCGTCDTGACSTCKTHNFLETPSR